MLVIALLVLAAASSLITTENINIVAGIAIIAVFAGYIGRILTTDQATSQEKRRVRGYIPMWIAAAVTFGITAQIFTTVPLFITDRVNLMVGGWEIPPVWIPTIGTVGLVIASAVMAKTLRTSRFGRTTATTKYVIGMCVAALGFFLLILTDFWPAGTVVSPFFVGLCMIICCVSEVFVGPIGLSLVTRVAPRRFYSQMVALQILSMGAGSVLAGAFGALYTAIPAGFFFCMVGGVGVGTAAVLAGFSRRIESQLNE